VVDRRDEIVAPGRRSVRSEVAVKPVLESSNRRVGEFRAVAPGVEK
jgi:hypothetical protein